MVTWTLDPAHSEVNFKVKHLMITNVTGTFKDYDLKVTTADEHFQSPTINFSAKTASIDTGSEQRDQHLKSADFFDTENYPELTFTGKGYEKQDDNTYKLTGDLTIRSITKPVKLDVEFGGLMKDPWGNTKAGFTITGKINRKDWDLNWNAALEAGGMLVSDDVRISCEIQLSKQAS